MIRLLALSLSLALHFTVLSVLSFAHAADITQGLIAVDGDTVKSGDKSVNYRLLGYDTPEIFHPRCVKEHALGMRAKLRMQQILVEGSYRLVDSGKKDKYRRNLATLYYRNEPVDQIFIRENLAYAYNGRTKRRDWCAESAP